MNPREFWISIDNSGRIPIVLPGDTEKQVLSETYYRTANPLIKVREVTGPDYKSIAEELMRALESLLPGKYLPDCACHTVAEKGIASAKKRMGE